VQIGDLMMKIAIFDTHLFEKRPPWAISLRSQFKKRLRNSRQSPIRQTRRSSKPSPRNKPAEKRSEIANYLGVIWGSRLCILGTGIKAITILSRQDSEPGTLESFLRGVKVGDTRQLSIQQNCQALQSLTGTTTAIC
jgi:hypothetical protein